MVPKSAATTTWNDWKVAKCFLVALAVVVVRAVLLSGRFVLLCRQVIRQKGGVSRVYRELRGPVPRAKDSI